MKKIETNMVKCECLFTLGGGSENCNVPLFSCVSEIFD
jgi:hypothetical protein